MMPALLTPEVQVKILAFLESGVTVEVACGAAGIKYDTFKKWLGRARAERKRLETPGTRPKATEHIYLEFLEATELVFAKVEARLTAGISLSAQGYDVERVTEVYERDDKGNLVLLERRQVKSREKDWKAAAWLLERRHPTRWGQKAQLEHTGNVGVIGIRITPPEDSS